MSDPRLLFLVRHGRSDESSSDLVDTPRGPQWDPPLDARGREQAELLSRRLLLMHPRPTAVYSSTMRRTRETVAPFAERAGIEVAFDQDLIEAHIGDWEAKGFEEILATDEDMLHRFRHQDAVWRHAPGGETLHELRTRVWRAIERLIARHPEGNLVVVAHGGVINAYVGQILGMEHAMFFLPENTSLNTIEILGDARQVRFLNDDRHLALPQLFEV